MQTALRQARLDPDAWAEAMARRAAAKTALAGRAVSRAAVRRPPAARTPRPPSTRRWRRTAPRFPWTVTPSRRAICSTSARSPCTTAPGERPRLTSQATLHYKDEEIYLNEGEGGATVISEKEVATRRMLAESAALAALDRRTSHARDAVALVDDPLILVFADQREKAEDQRKIVDEFCEMLQAAQAARTPVAGYISRPGARDVIGALRLTLCPDDCGHDAAKPLRRTRPPVRRPALRPPAARPRRPLARLRQRGPQPGALPGRPAHRLLLSQRRRRDRPHRSPPVGRRRRCPAGPRPRPLLRPGLQRPGLPGRPGRSPRARHRARPRARRLFPTRRVRLRPRKPARPPDPQSPRQAHPRAL